MQLGIFITWLTVTLVIGYGWVLNIIALLGLDPWIWTGKSIIGIIGIFVPFIGTIMGYFIW